MPNRRIILLAIISACGFCTYPACAQNGPTDGFYQIVSGHYSECCGTNDSSYDLPDKKQSFVRFTVPSGQNVASMTFLAEDMQTVFITVPCQSSGGISFNFDYGLIFSNRTFFHVDPGPPPYQMYWNYTASNSVNSLRIDGLVGTAGSPCLDAPTRFSHSNVVAVLVPRPRLSVVELSKDHGARILVQGNAGWTNVIEASTDLVTWTPINTNFMNYSVCPICPFIEFEDMESTNLAYRFYRAFEFR